MGVIRRPEPVLYLDMDGVQAHFHKAHYDEGRCKYQRGFFLNLEPFDWAIPAINELIKVYTDVYICSAPMDDNPWSATEKLLWLKAYFGDAFKRKVILASHKFRVGTPNDFLVDDWKGHGNINFPGEFIHFGSDEFKDWNVVKDYLLQKHDEWLNESPITREDMRNLYLPRNLKQKVNI